MPFTPDQVLFLDEDSTYGAEELGLPYRDLIGEGVVGAGDFAVTERAAGANMSVDVAAGACWIAGDDDADLQPTYRYREPAVTNLAVAAADPTNPRIDLVIAEVRDATFAGVNKDARLRVITGTPAGSPSAPALPNNAIPLAEVTVAALATTIEDADITDVRTRAKVGDGAAEGGGGAGGGSQFPINLQFSTDANAFWTASVLGANFLPRWEFLPTAAGQVYGSARIPAGVTPAAFKVVLILAANATTGAARFNVHTRGVADGEAANFGTFESSQAQDITVPGTALLQKTVEYTMPGATWAAEDLVHVAVQRDGAHGNDTLAVNALLLGAWLVVA